ncbi:MAG: hypothetical protein KAR06_06765, partial [Deltaproteobacteria bacterium]|nr:hypothetical protein [Deltaproteobacteria bacterium]
DHETTFSEALRVLKADGRLYFTTLGPETLKELTTATKKADTNKILPPPIMYPNVEDIRSTLERVGFKDISISREASIKQYPSFFELLRTLKSIGAKNPSTLNQRGMEAATVLKQAARIYNESFPSPSGHGIIATYDVIFIRAVK